MVASRYGCPYLGSCMFAGYGCHGHGYVASTDSETGVAPAKIECKIAYPVTVCRNTSKREIWNAHIDPPAELMFAAS